MLFNVISRTFIFILFFVFLSDIREVKAQNPIELYPVTPFTKLLVGLGSTGGLLPSDFFANFILLLEIFKGVVSQFPPIAGILEGVSGLVNIYLYTRDYIK